MRKILAVLAVCVAAVVPGFALAAPALANGAFDFKDQSPDAGLFANPLDCNIRTVDNGSNPSTFNIFGDSDACTGLPAHSDFSLIFVETAGGKNWYELEDLVPFGCMNVGSDTKVYNNSCSKTTTEQWAQIVVSDGQHWENRHYGTNGYLTIDCGALSCPGTILATANPVSWGTPTS